MKVKVTVNPIGEMKKLRTSVYGDRLAWVEELIQNSQRAGATEVRMTFDAEFVEVTDNGSGCESPKSLFEKSTSGWDEATTEEEGAFGEGFFSAIMVADSVEVWTKFGYAKFDIAKMFATNSVDCIEVDTKAEYEGFRVRLTLLKEDYDKYAARRRAASVGKYLQGISVMLRGYEEGEFETVEPKGFTDTDGSRFATVCSKENFVGWLRPSSYSIDGWHEVELFYQSRFVRELGFGGLSGVLAIKNKVVDVRCPDRKDFIYNNKLTAFRAEVKALAKEVMLKVVREGSDEELSNYASVVCDHLSVKELRPHVSFLVYDSNAENGLTEEQVEALKRKTGEGGKIDFEAIASIVQPQQDIDVVPDGYVFDGLTEQTELPVSEVAKDVRRTGIQLAEGVTAFYVPLKDLVAYNERVAEIRYHAIPVVISRNVMEENVLEDMGVQHVSEFHKEVRLVASLKNQSPQDEKEERAAWLFKVLAIALKLDPHTFSIGDLSVQREITIPGREPVREAAAAAAVADTANKVVYIDRVVLRKSCLKPSKSPHLLASDRAFLAKNLNCISHELAHLLFDTVDDTTTHFATQLEIQDTILNSLF